MRPPLAQPRQRLERCAFATLLVCALALLSGCYASQDPVIEDGEWINIVGRYACRDIQTGKAYGFEFKERKVGTLFPTYYYEANRKNYRFLKIDDSTYLGQEGDERNKLINLFLLRPKGRGAVVLVPDIVKERTRLDTLLAENRVMINGRTGNGAVILEGAAEDKITVMRAMPQELLKEIAICEPRPAVAEGPEAKIPPGR